MMGYSRLESLCPANHSTAVMEIQPPDRSLRRQLLHADLPGIGAVGFADPNHPHLRLLIAILNVEHLAGPHGTADSRQDGAAFAYISQPAQLRERNGMSIHSPDSY